MIIFLLNYILSFFFQIILFPPSFLSYLCTSCFFISSYSCLLDFYASTCNLIFSSSHQFFFMDSIPFLLLSPSFTCISTFSFSTSFSTSFSLSILFLFLLVLVLVLLVVLVVLLLLLLVISSYFFFLFLLLISSSSYFFFLLFLLLIISSSFLISPSFYFSFLFLFHNLFLLFFLTRGSNASETSECRIGLHRKKR